ncbi:hypothetical protein [Iodobacter fluviatilis]|nr:hypothetical protein [Iodobacter fluviatilis]
MSTAVKIEDVILYSSKSNWEGVKAIWLSEQHGDSKKARWLAMR